MTGTGVVDIDLFRRLHADWRDLPLFTGDGPGVIGRESHDLMRRDARAHIVDSAVMHLFADRH